MTTISEYANKAFEAEKAGNWSKAHDLWIEASKVVLNFRVSKQLQEFAERCSSKACLKESK